MLPGSKECLCPTKKSEVTSNFRCQLRIMRALDIRMVRVRSRLEVKHLDQYFQWATNSLVSGTSCEDAQIRSLDSGPRLSQDQRAILSSKILWRASFRP